MYILGWLNGVDFGILGWEINELWSCSNVDSSFWVDSVEVNITQWITVWKYHTKQINHCVYFLKSYSFKRYFLYLPGPFQRCQGLLIGFAPFLHSSIENVFSLSFVVRCHRCQPCYTAPLHMTLLFYICVFTSTAAKGHLYKLLIYNSKWIIPRFA